MTKSVHRESPLAACLFAVAVSPATAADDGQQVLPISYERQVRRAAEAAIWAAPAVSIYDIELSIQRDPSRGFGEVVYFTIR